MFSVVPLKRLIVAAVMSVALPLVLSAPAVASYESPPTHGGIIGNPTLRDNQDVINAQGVGMIVQFMDQGAQTCDEDGRNCRSLFGDDDSLDFTTTQNMSQIISGANSVGIREFDDDSNNVSSQVGALALACGDTKPHIVAGVAIRASNCTVNASGDAQLTFQVCTAPMRGNPVSNPENAVPCSSNPTSPNYRPGPGQVCIKKACDSEPVGSLDGWSVPRTIHWLANMPAGASDQERSSNGLSMVFYPDLAAGVTPSFSANSDTMTAVKIVQSFIHSKTGQQALGLKVAYRHKMVLTKQMLSDGAAAVTNPNEYTGHWDTLEKMSLNPMMTQMQEKVSEQATNCIQKIHSGIEEDQEVEVCDPNFVGESGVKPIDLSAKIAGPDEGCGTTAQCLRMVMNTNTWQHTCYADVPLGIRTCTVITNYTMEDIHSRRTRSHDRCTERRTANTYYCEAFAEPVNCTRNSIFTVGGIDLRVYSGAVEVRELYPIDQYTSRYRFGTVGDNTYWRGHSYQSVQLAITVRDRSLLKSFVLREIHYDDAVALKVNGSWVWSEYGGGVYHPQFDVWGRRVELNEDNATMCRNGRYGTVGYPCLVRYRTVSNPKGGSIQELVEGYYIQTHWERHYSHVQYPHIDLAPYLHEGVNYFRMDVGVWDGGEGWMYLDISGWQDKCDFNFTNHCAQFEADVR